MLSCYYKCVDYNNTMDGSAYSFPSNNCHNRGFTAYKASDVPSISPPPISNFPSQHCDINMFPSNVYYQREVHYTSDEISPPNPKRLKFGIDNILGNTKTVEPQREIHSIKSSPINNSHINDYGITGLIQYQQSIISSPNSSSPLNYLRITEHVEPQFDVSRTIPLPRNNSKINYCRITELMEPGQEVTSTIPSSKSNFQNERVEQFSDKKIPPSKRNKRQRTIFTPEQMQRLESEFETSQYLVGDDRVILAKQLNLSVCQVKIWFQNRRIKYRKESQEKNKRKNDELLTN